ncbi:PIR protein, putative [Plasmodium sp. gorilla clade G1]|nr:PIR protein, putative [Plasmodium sp. gorilla clade G1]
MKVHYINILLFALPLNILVTLCHVSSKKNPYMTHNTPSTKATGTRRTLCECEWYAPDNYDNDPEMKEVMENYNRQASERFKAYDERMNKIRQKCKEQCDKKIKKIILKDKIEKELTEKFSILDTNIATNHIPTCVCKKSLADKAENFCLKCGYELGGGVLQASSLLGGIGQLGIDAWKAAALITAKDAAIAKGLAAGEAARIPAGIKEVISGIRSIFPIDKLRFGSFDSFINARTYTDAKIISDAINFQYDAACTLKVFGAGFDTSMCDSFGSLSLVEGEYLESNITTKVAIEYHVSKIVTKATSTAAEAVKKATKEATSLSIKNNSAAVESVFNSSITSINASIIAILIIVLIMIIIYLILRYRRKKKMKKKLQYIKLLK